MRRVLVLALLAGGCGQARAPEATTGAGAELERAAVAAGLVPDPVRASIVGAWARDNDRVCVVPTKAGRGRIGVVLDYGEGNDCVAAGAVRRTGDRLRVDLGACRIDARFDGERIAFPAEVDEACARFCRGNASLAALSVERVSGSAAEAATLRAPSGRLLCAD
ncbi:hypothetical protein [uncultured Sphingomonas sp.]|uniref:hypothetical protein n=1 Tax=uncultured Sphingomonas sp. TaxID=158754 RepID=UPI0035C993DB